MEPLFCEDHFEIQGNLTIIVVYLEKVTRIVMIQRSDIYYNKVVKIQEWTSILYLMKNILFLKINL